MYTCVSFTTRVKSIRMSLLLRVCILYGRHSSYFMIHKVQSEMDCWQTKVRWGAGVETQKNVREEIGGWGRVPFIEPYAPLLSTIYDGA